MAVEDKYVNANVVAEKKPIASLFNGGEVVCLVAKASIAAADDDGSIYRLGRVNASMIPIRIDITNDAITAGTDYDLGLYQALNDSGAGAVLDADILADGVDMSSARAEGSGVTGLSGITLANSDEQLYTHAGETESDHAAEYDIALTANTVGSAAGDIIVKMYFVQG